MWRLTYTIVKINYIFLAFLIIFFSSLPFFIREIEAQGFSKKEVTLTTYYPTPHGTFKVLRILPQSLEPTSREGRIYYDSSLNMMRYRNDTQWVNLTGGSNSYISEGTIGRGYKVNKLNATSTEWIKVPLPVGKKIQSVVLLFLSFDKPDGDDPTKDRIWFYDNKTHSSSNYRWANAKVIINSTRDGFRVDFDTEKVPDPVYVFAATTYY
ncbi:MAG: hypothetical protein N2606_00385 [Candidatus Omnitrophica bacterium]|nr:hypothetical protein [Candidatus Omnitrophota bacterium]